MVKSSKKARPSKPHPDFPLFAHATGRWAKKVRGKLHYFGPWDDPDGALNRWLDTKDDLLAGRTPRANRDGLTVNDLSNRYLHAKRGRVDTGELTEVTWTGYRITCQHIIRFFGRNRFVEDLQPEDFEKYRKYLSKTNGLIGLRNQVRNARMVFSYAFKAGLIDRPVTFGPEFTAPTARALRKDRTPRMFEAAQIRRMLEHADPTMKAMVFLGVNAGFGNSDVARLPLDAIDLNAGWITYPRPKTGTERSVPLWPETIDALRAAIAKQREATHADSAGLVFRTQTGGSWDKQSTRYLTEQFRKFLQRIDRDEAGQGRATLYRRGVGFYTLRHVFETIGGEACDQVAVDAIMGHERGDMASVYRERISGERLQKVVDRVREWLFAEDAVEPGVVPFRVVG